jgi:hypothetical protein
MGEEEETTDGVGMYVYDNEKRQRHGGEGGRYYSMR